MTRPALLLVLLLLAGCRSSYDGPSFAGEWVTAPREDGRGMTLLLSQDLEAVLNATVRGELRDAEGRAWALQGEPARQGERGLLEGTPIRVGLRDPLVLLTDEGPARSFDSGPLPWKLVRGVDDGADAITIHVTRTGALWSGPEPGPWAHCTFFRRTGAPAAPPATPPSPTPAPAASACASCGAALQPAWRHCPQCGLERD